MYQQYLKLPSSWKLPEKEYQRLHFLTNSWEGCYYCLLRASVGICPMRQIFFVLDLGDFFFLAVVFVSVLVLVRKWNIFMLETQGSHLKMSSKSSINCSVNVVSIFQARPVFYLVILLSYLTIISYWHIITEIISWSQK